MTNNLKSIEEIVEEFSRMSARKDRVNAGLCATCGSKSDHDEVTEKGAFTHQFDAGVDARVWSEEGWLTTTLTQDRHAIGEMLLGWVEKVEKESKRHPAIYFKRPDKSDGFNAGHASAMEEVKTFIKSELMNKDV